MEAAAPSAKKRRAEPPETGTSSTPATAATETPTPEATPTIKKTGAHGSQEPPPPGAGGDHQDGNGGGVDRISGLPDAILGDIISLLPTKEAARTQVLASRWAHLWRAAPLNLDCRDLPRDDDEVLAAVVSRILSTHHGPARLFCVPAHHLQDRAATVDAWLRSPALDNLQEIEFCDHRRWPAPEQPPTPPASAFRFWATLRAATIGECHVPDGGPVQGIRFPQLQQLALALVRVGISEGSLHGMISSASCPALECLFLHSSHGFRRVRINSTTLRSIGLRTDYYGPDLLFRELVVEDAPCLEKLLCAERVGLRVSVVAGAAPRLETLGSLSNWSSNFSRSRHAFGSTVFQELHLRSFTSVVRSVKILSVDFFIGNLDMVIDLMKCFPCLEKLYVKGSLSGRREKNLWRRKHRHLTQFFDNHVKTLVLENYEGTRSHISFASFFLLNARELELMRLEVEQKKCNEEFFAQQRLKLQFEGRACRGARLDFALNRCHCRIIHIDHVHDLTIADPFECTC